MDFDKIRPAVEEIALDDIQKAKILDSCKNKKRKFNYKPIVGIVASAAAITLVLASPGFLFRATKADDTALELPAENMADSMHQYNSKLEDCEDVEIFQNASTSTYIPLFEADGFRDIYAIIPFEFSSLVSDEEYKSWSQTVTADGGMAMAQFVEYFGISREEFDMANALYSERTLAHISDSADYFDADVICSGNREAIDDFYKK